MQIFVVYCEQNLIKTDHGFSQGWVDGDSILKGPFYRQAVV